VWPIFAGERGEYEIAAHNLNGAQANLVAMAKTANGADLLSEQVWDNEPPSGQPGFASGSGTTSATPLAWAHAQFIRLAFDLAAGRLVEQPSIVAERYIERKEQTVTGEK
jgi:glucoamylase